MQPFGAGRDSHYNPDVAAALPGRHFRRRRLDQWFISCRRDDSNDTAHMAVRRSEARDIEEIFHERDRTDARSLEPWRRLHALADHNPELDPWDRYRAGEWTEQVSLAAKPSARAALTDPSQIRSEPS